MSDTFFTSTNEMEDSHYELIVVPEEIYEYSDEKMKVFELQIIHEDSVLVSDSVIINEKVIEHINANEDSVIINEKVIEHIDENEDSYSDSVSDSVIINEKVIEHIEENKDSDIVKELELNIIMIEDLVIEEINIKPAVVFVIPIKEITSQDFNQRLNMGLSILFELYRVITCSLLILFVPQNCNDTMCTTIQNLESTDAFYNFSLVINFISLVSFCPLYYLEIKRENRLIKYLDVNPELTNDDKGVEMMLTLLPCEKKHKIIKSDKHYQQFAYIIIGIYGFNVLCSSIVIFQYYLGPQTITVLITFILFITTKLMNVYSVANTSKNIFLSAYLKSNVQYNDIDAKYKIFDNL